MLQFSPGSFNAMTHEEQFAGGYWIGFDKGLELASPARLLEMLSAAQLRQFKTALARDDRAGLSIGLPSPQLPEKFSARATALYGERLQGLQPRWLDFLVQSSIRFGGESYPLMREHRLATVVPRLRASDLRDGEYDVVTRSALDYLREVACLAAVFAVNNCYAAQAELPYYRRCEI